MRAAMLISLVLASTAAVVGCGSSFSSAGGIQVVATTTQVADFVREVGGPRIHVHQILRPNSDPHEYEPTTGDAKAIAESRIVFRSGGDVDDWLTKVLQNAGGSRAVVTLSDSVRTMTGPPSGDLDPHWWQDPRNAELAVQAVERALIKLDPAGRREYRARGAAYMRRMERLDRQIAACMQKIPAGQRKLVTSHDALRYYARRYGVQIVGALIPSLSTQAEPSAGQIAGLVNQVRREHVRAIFPESSLNPKLERAVAKEAGVRVGAKLWADTLGPKGSSGANYVASMESNAQTMARGFVGRPVCDFRA
jgi:zinc/manganese transport system substrate-binding protein